MSDREELVALRRMAELEARASPAKPYDIDAALTARSQMPARGSGRTVSAEDQSVGQSFQQGIGQRLQDILGAFGAPVNTDEEYKKQLGERVPAQAGSVLTDVALSAFPVTKAATVGRALTGGWKGAIGGAAVANTLYSGLTTPGDASARVDAASTAGATSLVADALLKGGGKAAGFVNSKIHSGLSTKKEVANKTRAYLDTLIGGDPAVKERIVKAALEAQDATPGSLPAVSRAVSGVPEAGGLAAHEAALAKKEGINHAMLARVASNKAARDAHLKAGAGTTAARDAIEAKIQRDVMPLKAEAIREANRVPPSGMAEPSDVAAWIKNTRATTDALKNDAPFSWAARPGEPPVTTKGIMEQLNATLRDPDLGTYDVTQLALGKIGAKVLKYADENGVIDAARLPAIREEMGTVIQVLAEQEKAGAGLTAKLTIGLQKALDEALDTASGGKWSKYLTAFKAEKRKGNEMDIMRALSEKLNPLPGEESTASYLRAIRETQQPKTLEAATNFGGYKKFEDALGSENLGRIADVQKDVIQERAAARLAGTTNVAGAVDAPQNFIPGFLSVPITALKHFLKLGGEATEKKIQEKTLELFLNPKQFAEFMQTVPPAEKASVLKEFTAFAARQGIVSSVTEESR